jgi:non-ribosomal peptide synthetase component E (peptide arylation enzyme)
MDPIQKRELKRQAWMRLAAQQRRAGQLRGRVVVVSLICFVLLWGVVFAQMATGNDPVLAGKEKVSTSRAVASARKVVEREPVEAEPEVEEEAVEAEPEIVEEEPEPLVTSQS